VSSGEEVLPADEERRCDLCFAVVLEFDIQVGDAFAGCDKTIRIVSKSGFLNPTLG